MVARANIAKSRVFIYATKYRCNEKVGSSLPRRLHESSIGPPPSLATVAAYMLDGTMDCDVMKVAGSAWIAMLDGMIDSDEGGWMCMDCDVGWYDGLR